MYCILLYVCNNIQKSDSLSRLFQLVLFRTQYNIFTIIERNDSVFNRYLYVQSTYPLSLSQDVDHLYGADDGRGPDPFDGMGEDGDVIIPADRMGMLPKEADERDFGVEKMNDFDNDYEFRDEYYGRGKSDNFVDRDFRAK